MRDRWLFLPGGGAPYRRGREEFHILQPGLHLHALVLPFCPAVPGKRQKVLVAEMHGYLIQVRVDGKGRLRAEEIRFRARVLGQFVQVVLRVVSEEERPPAMAGARIVNRPDVGVLPLRPRNQRIEIGIERAKTRSTEEINAGGDQYHGAAGPPLRPPPPEIHRAQRPDIIQRTKAQWKAPIPPR